MSTPIEKRFHAAVNVIKSLPKNGAYQPSTVMMLQFYGLYKQATEGPCDQKKPSFWDIVGKAKWSAWNDNRHLTKEQAMQRYVDGLREIIETMSYTENVQNFVGSLDDLERVDLNDLDMIVPGMKEMAESHPNSPFNSRNHSPQHDTRTNNVDAIENTSMNKINGHLNNDSDSQDGHTPPPTPIIVEHQQQNITNRTPVYSAASSSNHFVDQSDDEFVDTYDVHSSELMESMIRNAEMLKQIHMTVTRMNADVAGVIQRTKTLEISIKEIRHIIQQNRCSNALDNSKNSAKYLKWWPFEHISPLWFVLLILWPFVARRVGNMLTPLKRTK